MELTHSVEALQTRLDEVRGRIELSARRGGRSPADVTLIAVSKTHPTEALSRALSAGLSDFGENRVQEAESKIEELKEARANWHLIGHLQSNKARRAAKLFDCIHTLDTVALAERLERACAEEGRDELRVLIQVDLGGESTKSGVPEDEVPTIVETIHAYRHLKFVGLMTLPPFLEDPDRVRPYFRRLREMRDDLRARGVFKMGEGELSMGMSHDYEVAVEEGSTMVRVGTAIFGARDTV
ncbi:MAG TPA: YggS family pyridoxal phosphate-dependent enzyme [Pyrinomonadaceae bacterium]|nr:YggS family pyridoxal phosphate-dependent enzyme [Pyrinomonadaceae bacterium]